NAELDREDVGGAARQDRQRKRRALEAADGLRDRAVPAAHRDDLRPARQEGPDDLRRVAGPARRRVDELEPAPAHAIDQRVHLTAAVALPGRRVVDEQAALHGKRGCWSLVSGLWFSRINQKPETRNPQTLSEQLSITLGSE